MSKDIKSKYTYVTDNEDKWTAIAIKSGKFEGVIYKYGKVTIPEEENSKGNLPFRFEYDILDNNMIPREEFDDDNFFKLLGDILVDIIDRQEDLNIGYTNDRENNSQ